MAEMDEIGLASAVGLSSANLVNLVPKAWAPRTPISRYGHMRPEWPNMARCGRKALTKGNPRSVTPRDLGLPTSVTRSCVVGNVYTTSSSTRS